MLSKSEFKKCNEIIKQHIDLILVHGKAHSGKGEVAKCLCEKHHFIEHGFADSLKVLAVNTFGWPTDLINNNSLRTVDSRSFMQIIGQAGRMFDEDFWIKFVAQKLHNFHYDWVDAGYAGNPKVVISDLRYPNEMEWGHSVGGRLWKVVRTGDFKKIQTGETHISETALDICADWDLILFNDSTLEVFYNKVTQAVSQ